MRGSFCVQRVRTRATVCVFHSGVRLKLVRRAQGVVAEALCAALRPLRARAEAWLRRPRALRHVLRDGAVRARRQADAAYEDAARRAGLAPARAAEPFFPEDAAALDRERCTHIKTRA